MSTLDLTPLTVDRIASIRGSGKLQKQPKAKSKDDDTCRAVKRFKFNPDAEEFVPSDLSALDGDDSDAAEDEADVDEKDQPAIIHRTINGVGLSAEVDHEGDEDYSADDLIGDLGSEDGGSFRPKDIGDETDDGEEHEDNPMSEPEPAE